MITTKANHGLLFSQCILCHGRCKSDQGICPDCLQDLPWIKSHCPCCSLPQTSNHLCLQCATEHQPFNGVSALFDYRFPVDQLISQVKYHQKPVYMLPLARLLADKMADTTKPDLLIPVPMHEDKLRLRGYNQAELIARLVGDLLNIPVHSHLLKKIRPTTQQMSLSREQRINNLKNAFSATQTRAKHIAIIDDVMTTGTTLRELCTQVRTHPTQRIDGWVLVRTAKDR
ncbi:MAG: ComF family protein [Pontibacterium sp.]